jgi:hypothetical protein
VCEQAQIGGEPHVFVSADTSQQPLFVKHGKRVNMGNLHFGIVSDLEPKISHLAGLGISTPVERALQITLYLCKTNPISTCPK